MKLSRRGFLRVAGITGSVALVGAGQARASSGKALDTNGENETGMLVDTTLCAGCRGCEAACSEANGLPPPETDEQVVKLGRREMGPEQFTVVNKAPVPGRDGSDRFAKRQCMHCVQPGCASACPVRAMDKTAAGPVIYRGERCMGCRYCMVACPFEIPKYEYEKAVPTVKKCTFCAARQAKGLQPACTSVCPTGALTFGTRAANLDEAKKRIYGQPDKYVHYVYGEHEAGGTNWLYISDVDFSKLDMKVSVDQASYPQLVKGALGIPPFVMTLWPPLLMGIYAFSKRREDVAKEERHE